MIYIGEGQIYHSRKVANKNSFRYPTFFVYLNCADEERLRQIMKQNFWGCLSLSAENYLDGEKGSIDQRIKNFLKERCHYIAEEVWLHTLPKMFGYAFNPVSFWFCRRGGVIEAVLVEVHNTFNERHFYWIYPKESFTSEMWLQTEKVFHVSPFFPVEGYYKFKFDVQDDRIAVAINYHAPNHELRLATGVEGVLKPLAQVSLSTILWNYGWMTPLVVIRIHYQAFKLWLFKTKFYSKPELPGKDVT